MGVEDRPAADDDGRTRPGGTPPGLGDPAPWFSTTAVSGARIDIHVDAGRYVLITFMGAPREAAGASDPRLGALLQRRGLFREDHVVCYVVVGAPPGERSPFRLIRRAGINFIADYDGALARQFGVEGRPWTFLLDPMLRVIASIAHDHPAGHDATLFATLDSLPPPDRHAGMPLSAPVLIVPRVFDFELCDMLVDYHRRAGGTDSGFLLDKDGVTATVSAYDFKRRTDCLIRDPAFVDELRSRVVRRLLPAIERAFSFKATRMDRYLIARYSAQTGDHFFRHRDNLNAGAAHRRFALTINLNAEEKNYRGGELRFPEFGTATYRPPTGAAIVFSCGLLHEVTPVTQGDRFAFLAFLYGEEDARIRAEANARLATGERRYSGDDDLLFTQHQA